MYFSNKHEAVSFWSAALDKGWIKGTAAIGPLVAITTSNLQYI